MTMQFKRYDQHQQMLLPPSLEDLLDEHDLAKIVSEVVEGVDDELLESCFKGGGCPPYDPRMMLKVLIYAYCNKLYSCRKIAKALKRDVAFMWISGMQYPDFNTVNRFRGDYFKEILEKVFTHTVTFLLDKEYISFQDCFIDGTKLEADANRHKAVWRKNTERYQAKISEKVKEVFTQVEEINKTEDKHYAGKDLPEYGKEAKISSEEIRATADEISKDLDNRPKDKQPALRKSLKELKKLESKQRKYEEQEKVLNGRNSYSPTDSDATFMRMKDGLLKPGYNLQAASENGFVTGFSISQNGNDGSSFIPHMQHQKEQGLPPPKRIIADAGYGYEQNYDYLNNEQIANYMQYPDWKKEQSNAAMHQFAKCKFEYDSESDTYKCPNSRKLIFVEESVQIRASGYKVQHRTYQCENCSGCEFKQLCAEKETNRTIKASLKLQHFQQQTRENLSTDLGKKLRKSRGFNIETVFGELKHNQGYRRIRLRKLAKVTAESALLFISHNAKKLYTQKMFNKVSVYA